MAGSRQCQAYSRAVQRWAQAERGKVCRALDPEAQPGSELAANGVP